jgi:hypothetical protein
VAHHQLARDIAQRIGGAISAIGDGRFESAWHGEIGGDGEFVEKGQFTTGTAQGCAWHGNFLKGDALTPCSAIARRLKARRGQPFSDHPCRAFVPARTRVTTFEIIA